MTLTQAQSLHRGDRIRYSDGVNVDMGTVGWWEKSGIRVYWDSDKNDEFWKDNGHWMPVFPPSATVEWWAKVELVYTHPCE